ncbi:MAG: hypothetical protein ACHRHE_03665 [Tepidisphaerales bacterium]
MSETPQPAKPSRLRRLFRVLGSVCSRTYAVVLVGVLGYAGYLAGAYLLNFVFMPAHVPGRLLQSQARADVAALRNPPPLDPLTDEGRPPLAHFHRVVRLSQPDPLNGCTVSGCHEPLPHRPKMKIPAFANFHVAFLACQSCHSDNKQRPVKSAWMDLLTSRPQSPPAVLRLVKLLSEGADLVQKRPHHVHGQILALLREIIQVRVQDRMLEELQSQIENSEPGSPIWRSAVKRLAADMPRYGRSNYGAKLIPENQLKTYGEANREMTDVARQYLAAADKSPERKSLNDRVHASVLKKPPACANCHSDTPGQIDFAAAGYTPARAATLGNLQLARIVEEIREGREFRLPELKDTEGTDGK